MGTAALILVLIAIVVGAIGFFALVGQVILMIPYLLVAGAVGWLADRIVPGELPGGFLGAIAAGIIGGFLGRLVFGQMGPSIAGVYLLPTLIGAGGLAFGIELYNRSRSGQRF